MKKDPVRAVGMMNIYLWVTLVVLSIIGFIAKEEGEHLWILGLVLLSLSMSVVSAAFKHMAKRIDELEKKLETNQTDKAS